MRRIETFTNKRELHALAAFIAIGWADQTDCADVLIGGVELSDEADGQLRTAIQDYVAQLNRNSPALPAWHGASVGPRSPAEAE